MKRKFFLTLLMATAMLSSYADGELSYNFNYTDRTCEVKGYSGESKDVIIPAKVEYLGGEYTVTSIREHALQSKDLTSVTLPESLTSIGRDAFLSNRLEYVYYNAIDAECTCPFGSNFIGIGRTVNLILGPKVKVAPAMEADNLEFWQGIESMQN